MGRSGREGDLVILAFVQGDIVEINYGSPVGHEPKGKRPALVVSKDLFNDSTSMTIVCPITSTNNGFYLHEPIPAGHAIFGFIVLEQLRALDLEARQAEKIDHLNPKEMTPVLTCLKSFF